MLYPGGIKKEQIKKINYDNRGMDLESDINYSNDFYLASDKAIIYKKPTPIKITNVDYKSRKEATIKEGFFTLKSTTDYNGIYKGKYIDFEAKETKSKTSFPLSNIHPHQIKHMQNVKRHGGISFIIISFKTIGKLFLIDIDEVTNFINTNERKSLPLSFLETNAHLVKTKYNPRVDYLEIIDKLHFGGNNNGKKNK